MSPSGHHFTQWNSAPEVADHDFTVINGDINPLAMPHDKFVYTVVNNLFEKNVDAVFIVVAFSGSANIHPGPHADMLER